MNEGFPITSIFTRDDKVLLKFSFLQAFQFFFISFSDIRKLILWSIIFNSVKKSMAFLDHGFEPILHYVFVDKHVPVLFYFSPNTFLWNDFEITETKEMIIYNCIYNCI